MLLLAPIVPPDTIVEKVTGVSYLECQLDFNYPTGSRLGLFTAMQNIGGLLAIFFCKWQKPV